MHDSNRITESSKKQKDGGNEPPQSKFIGTYAIDGSVRVSVKRGAALDYAETRAAQLQALLNLTYGAGGENFRSYSSEIQDNVLWLAAGLAGELGSLVQLVDADASSATNGGAQ